MNEAIQIEYPRFFQSLEHSPEVNDVLLECATDHLPAVIKLTDAGARLSAGSADKNSGVLRIGGNWRSALIGDAVPSTNALLLLPFLFHIQEIHLPHRCLYSYGRHTRTVADIFMRNYFHAVSLRENISIQRLVKPKNSAISNASKELAKTYRWIVKACLKDKLLEKSNASELILAVAHLDVFKFDNPLLQAAAREFQDMSQMLRHDDVEVDPKDEFLQLRAEMLAAYSLG